MAQPHRLPPLTLVRTDPGTPHIATPFSVSPAEDKTPSEPYDTNELLWLTRGGSNPTTDGVVVVPYKLGRACETPPACWFKTYMDEFFYRESGAVVYHLRVYTLPGLDPQAPPRTVMLLPDLENVFYCTSPPPYVTATTRTYEAPAWVDLFEVYTRLEEHTNGRCRLDTNTLHDFCARVEYNNKDQDSFLRASAAWSQRFDQLQLETLSDIVTTHMALQEANVSSHSTSVTPVQNEM